MRPIVGALAVFVFAGILVPARAQFQNPIQAAKDAYSKAKQQSQQQKQQGQPQNQQSAPTQTASAAQPAAFQTSSATSGDCCSADALKQQAASASVLDIVGIKLGMNPTQVVAAIKTYNPSYRSRVMNSRLTRPSNPNGFTNVPRYIYADSPNQNLATGQREHITVQFTLPPNPPVVQEVQRYITFQTGQPVLSSNLRGSLEMKYGQPNVKSPSGDPIWVYDSNGKLLSQVPNGALDCQPPGSLATSSGSDPTSNDSRDPGINLSNTVDGAGFLGTLTPRCVPYLYAEAWGTGVSPNDKVYTLTVSIRSGALIYNSVKAAHNWLQAEADALQKKSDSDAAGRAVPKL